jgi:hypothetical protein
VRLLLFLLAGCQGGAFHASRCNGAEVLCDRRFDQVSYPTTHNAFSTVAGNFGAPNQDYDMPRQLADGVRGLMLDAWYYPDENGASSTYLCHGLCQIGAQPLAEGLGQIRRFLDQHRAEVVTLIFESYISAADAKIAFDAAGLTGYALPHGAGESWPTLREMIESDRRLVVFTADDAAFDWYLDEFTWAWENPYDNPTPADFRCTANRGQPTNDLFVLNHFLESALPLKSNAERVNQNPDFLAHAQRCRSETGRLPNFVTVDWYNVGDLFAVVDALNGL